MFKVLSYFLSLAYQFINLLVCRFLKACFLIFFDHFFAQCRGLIPFWIDLCHPFVVQRFLFIVDIVWRTTCMYFPSYDMTTYCGYRPTAWLTFFSWTTSPYCGSVNVGSVFIILVSVVQCKIFTSLRFNENDSLCALIFTNCKKIVENFKTSPNKKIAMTVMKYIPVNV